MQRQEAQVGSGRWGARGQVRAASPDTRISPPPRKTEPGIKACETTGPAAGFEGSSWGAAGKAAGGAFTALTPCGRPEPFTPPLGQARLPASFLITSQAALGARGVDSVHTPFATNTFQPTCPHPEVNPKLLEEARVPRHPPSPHFPAPPLVPQ